ncbi:MAG: general secretion pathway protein GspL [Proteobacteria bacterium]|nr:general secretion pathway protein GspL [Pseudomonadota bacterium]
MPNCFLFTDDLNEEGALSLCLDEQGHILAPLQFRNFAEIKELQINKKTIVVCPSNRFTLHEVELPRLSESKLSAALPYALEEKLPESVEKLHFAFDKNYYQNGRYLVVVADKKELEDLIEILLKNHLKLDLLTIDWFALKNNEAALLKEYILSNNTSFKGAIPFELAPIYFKDCQQDHFYQFKDSSSIPFTDIELKEKHETSVMWLAKRFLKMKAINLCQGSLQYKDSKNSSQYWLKISLSIAALWLISFLTFNCFKFLYLNKKIKDNDSQIAVIYHQFFPDAKMVISPKFRISQLIKGSQNQSNLIFWSTLNKLDKSTEKEHIELEQIRFQNQTIIVKIIADSFENLEKMQNKLKRNEVKVKQTEASLHENKVIATLELSL